MPIYAYKCSACGHAQDTLQKMSDAPLTVCPACGAAAYQKQVTAAGFQLKGSGWYVTDFRDGGKPADSAGKSGDAAAKPAAAAESGGGDKPAAAPAPAAASASPAPAPASAPAPAAAPASSGS